MNKKKSRKFTALFLTAVMLLAALSGCALMEFAPPETTTEVEPDTPSTVQPAETSDALETEPPIQGVNLPYYPSSVLNPYRCENTFNQTLGRLIYEGLFELTPAYEASPSLCARWETDDNISWKFVLRDDARFSDGTVLTAQDVVYSYGLVTSLYSIYASRFDSVLSIVAADASTVVITLQRANAYLPRLLDIPIIPDGAGDDAVPLGTGPYAFSEGTGGYSLIENLYWWQGDQPVDTIGLVETESQEQTLYDFQTGKVNFVVYDRTSTGTVVYRNNSERVSVGTTTMQYIGFNTDTFFTGETNVRAALSLGIDRETIAGTIFEGFAEAAVLPVSPSSAVYDEALAREYAYQPGALADALYDIGFRDTNADGILEHYQTKFTLDFIVNSENASKVAAAQSITQTMREAGIDVTLRVLDWDDYVWSLETRNFDLYYGEIKLQSDFDLYSLLYSYQDMNYGAYSNATADTLLTGYLDGSATASELYAFLAQSAPIVPILFKQEQVLSTRGLLTEMYATASNPFYRLSDWVFNIG